MPRNARCVLPGVAYHVTQRGTDRQRVFFSDGDRRTYLRLAEAIRPEAGVEILAFCLMPNHVHWIVAPAMCDSMAVFFRRLHGRYAQYLNARLERSGHLWQNRYFACALGSSHLPRALAYVDANPVHAGLVLKAEDFRWSSAPAHLGHPSPALALTCDPEWKAFWESGLPGVAAIDANVLSRCTYSGRPFGDDQFLAECEKTFQRKWRNLGPWRNRHDARIAKVPERSDAFVIFAKVRVQAVPFSPRKLTSARLTGLTVLSRSPLWLLTRSPHLGHLFRSPPPFPVVPLASWVVIATRLRIRQAFWLTCLSPMTAVTRRCCLFFVLVSVT